MEIKNGAEIERMVMKKTRELKDGYLVSLLFNFRQDWTVVIDETGKTGTASMGALPGGGYVMKFGRKFLEKHVPGERELYFVYLHELFHMANGDLMRSCPPAMRGRGYREYNILFDICINSMIIKNHYKDGWHFLDRFYGSRKDTAVSFLLHPAFTFAELKDNRVYEDAGLRERIRKEAETAVLTDAACIKDRKEFARLYLDAWFKRVSIGDLVKRMVKIMDLSHAAEFTLVGGMGGKSQKYTLREEKGREKDEEALLIEAVKKAIDGEGSGQFSTTDLTAVRGVLPCPGRRELFMLKAGLYPVFFRNTLESECVSSRDVRLYVDVSSSMDAVLPFIYKLLKSIKGMLTEPIYLFSGSVTETTIADVMRGEVESDYGTNFDVMLNHALNNKFSKILVISDGYGGMSGKTAKEFAESGTELYLLLTDKLPFSNGSRLAKIAKKSWVLERRPAVNV